MHIIFFLYCIRCLISLGNSRTSPIKLAVSESEFPNKLYSNSRIYSRIRVRFVIPFKKRPNNFNTNTVYKISQTHASRATRKGRINSVYIVIRVKPLIGKARQRLTLVLLAAQRNEDSEIAIEATVGPGGAEEESFCCGSDVCLPLEARNCWRRRLRPRRNRGRLGRESGRPKIQSSPTTWQSRQSTRTATPAMFLSSGLTVRKYSQPSTAPFACALPSPQHLARRSVYPPLRATFVRQNPPSVILQFWRLVMLLRWYHF